MKEHVSKTLPATRWDSIESLLERIEKNEFSELNECTRSWQIVLDNKACFRFASRYYLDLTGIDENALLGSNFLTLVRGDISEAQARVFNDHFHNHENIQDFLFSRTQPDGVKVYIISNAVPQYDKQGHFIGYLARSQLVGETLDEVISERGFELFDACPLGVSINNYVTQADGTISSKRLYANDTIAKLFGYSPAEFRQTPVSASWADEASLQKVNSILSSGAQLSAELVTRVNANGELIWLEMTSQLFVLKKETYQLIWHHDVTKKEVQAAALATANLELEKLSTTDGLTRLANRRHFDAMLQSEWNRALRSGSNLALLMIDVDHFKLYNDEYGHPKGDDCLKKISQVLATQAKRTTDCAARYGGEEFALIMPDSTEARIAELAEVIRRSVYDLNIPHSGSALGTVTVSLGSAIVKPTQGDAHPSLIDRADEALYEAKKQGRNQAKCFPLTT